VGRGGSETCDSVYGGELRGIGQIVTGVATDGPVSDRRITVKRWSVFPRTLIME